MNAGIIEFSVGYKMISKLQANKDAVKLAARKRLTRLSNRYATDVCRNPAQRRQYFDRCRETTLAKAINQAVRELQQNRKSSDNHPAVLILLTESVPSDGY